LYYVSLCDISDPDQAAIIGHMTNLQLLTKEYHDQYHRDHNLPWEESDVFWNAKPDNCIANLTSKECA
jgi:hypothetical protein